MHDFWAISRAGPVTPRARKSWHILRSGINMKIITGIISLLGCISTLGYTLNQTTKTVTTDGSSSDVQSAISAASDDWTVLVPSGSFSWSGISISGKGIWIKGAGAASTTVSGSI